MHNPFIASRPKGAELREVALLASAAALALISAWIVLVELLAAGN